MCPRLSEVGREILSLKKKLDDRFPRRNKRENAGKNSLWHPVILALHLSCYCHLEGTTQYWKHLDGDGAWEKGGNERGLILTEGKGLLSSHRSVPPLPLKFTPWNGVKNRFPTVWGHISTFIHWEEPLSRNQDIQLWPGYFTYLISY